MAERSGGSSIPYHVVTAAFSVVVNLLMLVTPLYMLQIYDRVLTSGSVETLVLVSAAALGLLIAYGFAEAARRKTLSLLSDYTQARYGPALFNASFADPKRVRSLPDRIADLTAVQSYYLNGLALPFFDLPFTPVFLLAMFLIHPWVGWLGVIGGVVLLLAAIAAELMSRKSEKRAREAEQESQLFSQYVSRHYAAICSLGMTRPMFDRWSKQKAKASQLSMQSSGLSSVFGSHAKGLRFMLQIAALGLGAWLVLRQQVSGGAIVAGSILLGRALAPVDQLLGSWRQVVRFRQAWANLKVIQSSPLAEPRACLPMPRPEPVLTLQRVEIASLGQSRPLLPKFNLQVEGGTILFVMGQSGAGKTSLLKSLVGVWPLLGGIVRLGGRDVHSWLEIDRGQYVGYAPQDIELLPGSIAANICRFSNAEPVSAVSVAQKLGFHEFILEFADGYDTEIGPTGIHLSQGQQQMINLARAFYGDPVLMCLDEPTSCLDSRTFEHLCRALVQARERGAIIFISTHDTRLLELADKVLLLSNGGIQMVAGADYRATVAKPTRPAPAIAGGKTA